MAAKESETTKLAMVNLRRKQEAEELAIQRQQEKQQKIKNDYLIGIHQQLIEKERLTKEENQRRIKAELDELAYLHEKDRR